MSDNAIPSAAAPAPSPPADLSEDTLLHGVVLLGKGGYGDAPKAELDRMIHAVRTSGRYAFVTGAFVEQGRPSIESALESLSTEGVRRILVVPAFVPMDRSLRVWLPKIVRRWLRKRSDTDVDVVLADPLGDHRALGEAIRQIVVDAERRPDVRTNAPRDRGDPSWSRNPPHKHHVLFCMGPRCTSQDSGELLDRLHTTLERRRMLSGPDQVRITRTGCLYPCNLGPLMVVYPDGAWYCALDDEAIDRVVERHLEGGTVLDELTCPPATHPYKRPNGVHV
ncbi:MAG: NAD(P)H-dependent oxidoreductase subunit E [Chloroflexi bacterium]|nr:NAD(P)H-dependent oxidoreductase subunit E [Chloroflexota bacterium]MCY3938441.1 NAD(P)H-dependent oxidoreductase subunit E [Chloroflexota bacterium]